MSHQRGLGSSQTLLSQLLASKQAPVQLLLVSRPSMQLLASLLGSQQPLLLSHLCRHHSSLLQPSKAPVNLGVHLQMGK